MADYLTAPHVPGAMHQLTQAACMRAHHRPAVASRQPPPQLLQTPAPLPRSASAMWGATAHTWCPHCTAGMQPSRLPWQPTCGRSSTIWTTTWRRCCKRGSWSGCASVARRPLRCCRWALRMVTLGLFARGGVPHPRPRQQPTAQLASIPSSPPECSGAVQPA